MTGNFYNEMILNLSSIITPEFQKVSEAKKNYFFLYFNPKTIMIAFRIREKAFVAMIGTSSRRNPYQIHKDIPMNKIMR